MYLGVLVGTFVVTTGIGWAVLRYRNRVRVAHEVEAMRLAALPLLDAEVPSFQTPSEPTRELRRRQPEIDALTDAVIRSLPPIEIDPLPRARAPLGTLPPMTAMRPSLIIDASERDKWFDDATEFDIDHTEVDADLEELETGVY